MHVAHDRVHIPAHLCSGHRKQCIDAVSKRCGRTERHKGVHIRGAMPQALEAADKKLLIDHHDRDSKEQLYQSHCDVIPVEKGRQRPVPHHMPHRHIHERDQKHERSNQTFFQKRCRLIPEHFFIIRGAAAGSLLCAALFRCTVAGCLDCPDNVLRRSCPFHAHRVRQKTDRAARHTRYL